MKRDSAWFEGGSARLIYIAKRLRDATRLEAILTDEGVDFGVEADEYYGGVIFRRIRVGAFFYVLPAAYDLAIAVLERNGYKPEPPEPPEPPTLTPHGVDGSHRSPAL